ncbi:MAG: SAM-dependent methyltransferase [Chitinophagaceae bacterium]|nr:MAG: SAM-dependent methyltransferase [Chitinophagaceae bacterium]
MPGKGLFIRKKLKGLLNSLFYSGDAYSCPICNFSSDIMLATGKDYPIIKEKQIIGAGLRNTACIKCGSCDRERLIFLFLKDYIHIFEKENPYKVLHIAPEIPIYDKLKKLSNIDYVCGDKFEKGYDYPRKVQNIDITKLEFPDNSFDLIVCNHVLEHIPNDMIALSELYRVLKPNGIAMLQVPLSIANETTFEDLTIKSDEERIRFFGQKDHVRLYGKDYPNRLKSAGFSIEILEISNKEEYKKYNLNTLEKVFIGKKIISD